jgi:hypothetical protein
MHRLIHEGLLLEHAIQPSRSRNGCVVRGPAKTVVEFPDAVAGNQEFVRLELETCVPAWGLGSEEWELLGLKERNKVCPGLRRSVGTSSSVFFAAEYAARAVCRFTVGNDWTSE